MIPTDQIRILNPRMRNRRAFKDMVANLAGIDRKRPITVAPRPATDPTEYDVVCGQCLVMRLEENCVRRQHNLIDLMREIGTLWPRG